MSAVGSATGRLPASGNRERLLGLALVVLSACGFGSGALFAKPIYGTGVDWLTLLAWRFLFAAVLSWGWLLLFAGSRAALRRISRRRVAVLVVLGTLYVGNSGTYFAALETVSASLAALIVYLYPALVAVMSIRFARRLEGRRAWFALAIATAGVALAVGGIEPQAAPPIHALVLVVASPILYAVWIILAARLSGERAQPAEGKSSAPPYDSETTTAPEQTDSAPAAAIMLSATAAAWWFGAIATGRPVWPDQVPAAAWPALLGVGIVATAVAVQAFYAGARRIGAGRRHWSARSSRSTPSRWRRCCLVRHSDRCR